MQSLIDLLLEYWIIPVGVVIWAAPSVYSYLNQKMKNIKLPSFKKTKAVEEPAADDLIDRDMEAIYWLAKRAVEVQDSSLVQELENVNKKFYYIHCNMRKSSVSDSSGTENKQDQ